MYNEIKNSTYYSFQEIKKPQQELRFNIKFKNIKMMRF